MQSFKNNQDHGVNSDLSISSDNSRGCYDELFDPSLRDGCRIIFEKEVLMELRNGSEYGSGHQSRLELIKTKVLLYGPDDQPEQFRMELSSEHDLFFHFSYCINESEYQSVQLTQRLIVEFVDYPLVIIKMIHACMKDPQINPMIFTMEVGPKPSATLDFVQNMHYKFVELVSCPFLKSPDEIIQRHVSFRYNLIKSKLLNVEGKYDELCKYVRLKNPSLLIQLNSLHR